MTWTRLPPKRKREKMGVRQSSVIDFPGHLAFVRSRECCCAHHVRKCEGRIEAHHQVTRGAGGGDEQAVPLCSMHHALLDSPGWSQKRLEAECRVDFAEVARGLWAISKPAQRWRMKQEAA